MDKYFTSMTIVSYIPIVLLGIFVILYIVSFFKKSERLDSFRRIALVGGLISIFIIVMISLIAARNI